MNHLRLKHLFLIGIAPLIVFTVHMICYQVLFLYDRFWWLDIPMHFLGGASIAMSSHFFLNALEQEGMIGRMHWHVRILFIITLVSLAATLWEFAEFGGDMFIYHRAHFQPSIGDTMKDLFMGLFGGFTTSWFITKRK